MAGGEALARCSQPLRAQIAANMVGAKRRAGHSSSLNTGQDLVEPDALTSRKVMASGAGAPITPSAFGARRRLESRRTRVGEEILASVDTPTLLFIVSLQR